MTDIRDGQEPGERAPAPEPLRLVQRFLNTVDLEDDLEAFTSPAALGEWLVNAHLMPPGTTLTADDLHRAVAFREAVRDLLAAHTGRPVPGDAAERFQSALGGASLGGTVDGGGGISLVPRSPGLDGALAALLAIIHSVSVDGTWQRLKTCHNHACRWAFYDASRNRSGTWCAMGICGSRSKARTWRRRHGS